MAHDPQNHEHDVDPASAENVTTTEGPEAPADPELDLRQHAEMLARLAADTYYRGLLLLQGRDAEPSTGQEQESTVGIEEWGIVDGRKRIPTRSRKIRNRIVDGIEDISEHGPHHFYVPLAIINDELPPARRFLSETDIVGVLGFVAYFEGVADYEEQLPLEPDYVLASGPGIQAFYLLDEPALVAEAKPVAMALQEQAKCDPTTADLTCGWWIAGTHRYLSKDDEPVRVVKRWDGKSCTTLGDLQSALGIATAMRHLEAEEWPRPLGLAAFHGLPGKVVETLLPHTEADPGALLVHFLACFGSAVGSNPHARVEGVRHKANLYAAFVGRTGAGRKGTAAALIRELFARADPDWAARCVQRGVSTGEGVIEAIRDPIGNDEGVADKRLLLREAELSRMFRVMGRRGNTLQEVIRTAWDGSPLQTLTKKPSRVNNPHVSVAGDITAEELEHFLGRLELVNGFANRFMFFCIRRSKFLSEGGALSEHEIDDLAAQIREALNTARQIGLVERTPKASELWSSMYKELAAERPDLLGAATNRAAPQVLRVSMINALANRSADIRPEHLMAAREVWRYAYDSARYVIGDARDPSGEKILKAIRDAGEHGLSKTQIHDRVGRHMRRSEIDGALFELEAAGHITKVRVKTPGRPKEVWIAKQ